MRKIKAIVCTDDRGGYLFHQRRVSSDRVVTEDILEYVGNNKLWMSPYSAGLFRGIEKENIFVDEEYLEKADANDYCIIEDQVQPDVWSGANEIVWYKWNRVYPYDTVFPTNSVNDKFQMTGTTELKGNSHEKITKEVYSR